MNRISWIILSGGIAFVLLGATSIKTSRYQYACTDSIVHYQPDLVALAPESIRQKIPIGKTDKYLYRTDNALYVKVGRTPNDYRMVVQVKVTDPAVLWIKQEKLEGLSEEMGTIEAIIAVRDSTEVFRYHAAIINTEGEVFRVTIEKQRTDYWTNGMLTYVPLDRMGYSARAALLAGQAASLAYLPFETEGDGVIEAALAESPFQLIKTFHLTDPHRDWVDTQAILLYREKINVAVLAIRGTAGLKDLFTDALVRFVAMRRARLHRGFYHSYLILHHPLAEEFRKLKDKYGKFQLIVTGHSLGGAIANIASQQLAFALESDDEAMSIKDLHGYLNLAACFTFGCPRVGTDAFDFDVEHPLYRVTRGADPIPHIPPYIPFWFPYQHAGSHYELIPGTGTYRRNPPVIPRWTRFLLRFVGDPRRLFMANDHSMAQGYVEDLWRVVDRRNPEWRPIPTVRRRPSGTSTPADPTESPVEAEGAAADDSGR